MQRAAVTLALSDSPLCASTKEVTAPEALVCKRSMACNMDCRRASVRRWTISGSCSHLVAVALPIPTDFAAASTLELVSNAAMNRSRNLGFLSPCPRDFASSGLIWTHLPHRRCSPILLEGENQIAGRGGLPAK
jgi:hypothetical protein